MQPITEAQRQRDLEALQDAVYRDQVLRARAMRPEERFQEVCDLSDEVFQRMHDGVRSRLGIDCEEEGWLEVRRCLDRLERVQDRGIYTNARPDLFAGDP